MSAISLSGLQTGIDTSLLIQQLVAASSRPVELLQQRQARWQSKADAFSALQVSLEALRTAADAIHDSSDLRAYAVQCSNDDTVTAQVASGATEGTHEIVVDQLAAAEREVHAGLAVADTLVGVGAFSYTYNGQTRTIQTSDQTTLQGLSGLINNDAGNPGVRASVLEYDAGGDQVYHLVLGGDQTGADYAIAVNDAQTTLDGTGDTVDFRQATFTESQTARSSRVRVDGYPAGAWIERDSNTIDDILAGITLRLHAAGTAQVSLTRDTEGLKTKLAALVDAYNDAVDLMKQQTAYDQTTASGGVLSGEYTIRHVRQQLRLPIIEKAVGFLAGTDAYTLAGRVGLSIDRYGQLGLDEDTLDEALTDDYLGVLNLLGADRTGASDSANLQYYGATTATTPGTYAVRAVLAAGVLVSAQVKLATEGDGAWRDAVVEGNLIIGADGYPEGGLRVTAAYDGSGTVEAEVRIRQGIGGRLFDTLDNLLASTDGTIALAEKRCENAISGLQKNIERQEYRLSRMELRLRTQFARLEQALTMLEAQRMALGAGTSA